MKCESISNELPVVTSDQPDDHSVWLGYPPSLLRFEIMAYGFGLTTEGGSYVP